MTDFRAKYGPWAVVAGASEGLGAAFAESLARRKLNLVLIARREALLNSLAEKLSTAEGVETRIAAFNLGNANAIDMFVTGLDVEVGLLVYNAAFAPVGSWVSMSTSDLQRVVDINVTAPLLLARHLAPAMVTRGRGGIVLMSSLAGVQGSPRIATYAASKAFNSILAEGLWSELRDEGIDVIASRAGAIRTPGYVAMGTAEAPGTLDAEIVAEQTLNALGKGPFVVPGLLNRVAHFAMSRLLPRKTAIGIMSRNTQDLS